LNGRIMDDADKSVRKRLNADERRALKVAAIERFLVQYGRRAQKRTEPNDRPFDREVEQSVRRMKPETLDKLMRDDED
jgi:hypothetical protein